MTLIVFMPPRRRFKTSFAKKIKIFKKTFFSQKISNKTKKGDFEIFFLKFQY